MLAKLFLKKFAMLKHLISNSCKTGCSVRITKGNETKIIANKTPILVKTICRPKKFKMLPIQPSSPYTVASVKPATDVGKAKGRSTAASRNFFPEKL